MARVLILDDDEARHLVYASRYKRHEVVHAKTFSEAQRALDGQQFDLVHLDHDLGDFTEGEGYTTMYGSRVEYTGADVARIIRAMDRDKRPTHVVIHSWNPDGVKNIHSILKGSVENLTVERFSVSHG